MKKNLILTLSLGLCLTATISCDNNKASKNEGNALEMAQEQIDANNLDSAQAILERALENDESNEELITKLGKVYTLKREDDKAEKVYNNALDGSVSSKATMLIARAEARLNQGLFEEAKADAEKGLELAGDNQTKYDANFMLTKYYLELGDCKNARTHLEAAQTFGGTEDEDNIDKAKLRSPEEPDVRQRVRQLCNANS